MAVFHAFVVSFALLYHFTEAFLPFLQLGLKGEASSRTLDHVSITKFGLLQSMVSFFKENPQYILGGASGNTEDLSDIFILADSPNETDKLFSNIQSAKHLQNAIKEIQASNAEVDTAPIKNVAATHFTEERIQEASMRLQELRSAVIASMLRGMKYEHSRKLVGRYLHTLQEFYSRSNWVEIGNRVTAYDGFTNKEISIPVELITKSNQKNCIQCTLGKEKRNGCDNTLLTEEITSGYQKGQKPGNIVNCSHGEIANKGGDKKLRGGINKDFSSRPWSTNHKLHMMAAELAIQATKSFFDDLRSVVGDDRFARFLNLQAVRTLSLVIDDTGSMISEIIAVRKLSTDFARKSNNSVNNTPFIFIFVPFNDPEVGPVTVTSDPDEVIKAVNSLSGDKGMDCPELGMMGLYQALLHSLQDSVLYYFSDADAKDLNLMPVVLSLAKQKRVKLNFVLSGKCSYRRKRRSAPLPHVVVELPGSQHIYQSLAAVTGGQVLHTRKNEMPFVMDVIGSQVSAEAASDLIEVILLDVRSDIKQEVHNVSYLIQADNTLKNVLIVLSAEGSPRITLFNPSETKPIKVKMTRNFGSAIHVTEVRSFEGGPIEIRVWCTGPYSLQVTGRSALDFTYQLSSMDNADTNDIKPIHGDPVKGQTLLLNIAFTKPRLVNEVTFLSLVNTNGTVLESFSVQRGQGIDTNSFNIVFAPTVQRFRFLITAKTTEGKILQRIKPTEIRMETVELSFDGRSVNNFSRIFPGIPRKIPLKIKNVGSSQILTLKANDDLGFVQSVNPGSLFVAQNKTVQSTLIVKAPSDAIPGDTTTVTVYAIQSNSQQPSNYMIFYVSVAVENSELFPPSCEVGKPEKTCDEVYDHPNCSHTIWTSNISVFEMGKGLPPIITTKNPRHGLLTVAPPLTEGTLNSSVTGFFSSTCCHPSASIIVVDLFGNTGYCHITTVTPIINIKAQTKSTEIDVFLGETIKIQFAVTNLGTEGYFTLQISEDKHFTGYVTPLNVKLGHKESARGLLVLAGLSETRSRKTSLLFTAIPQTNTANNTSHVKLLKINVTVGIKRPKELPLEWNISAALSEEFVTIQYGSMRASAQLTLKNNGIAGTFDLKISSSELVLGQFARNTVHLNTGEKVLVDLIFTAKKNLNIEETLLLGTVARREGTGGEEIKLKRLKIKIIRREHENKSPSLKFSVPNRKVAIQPGSTLTVNFTVINAGRDQQFFFKVSSPKSLECHVTPESAFIKENMTMSGKVTITSAIDVERRHMQVNVTAIASVEQRSETSILNLAIDILESPLLPDEIKEKEQSNGTIKIIAIAVGCVLLLVLILFFAWLCMKKRGSWTVWKDSKTPTKKDSEKTASKPQLV